jgi:hypothetical protein
MRTKGNPNGFSLNFYLLIAHPKIFIHVTQLFLQGFKARNSPDCIWPFTVLSVREIPGPNKKRKDQVAL